MEEIDIIIEQVCMRVDKDSKHEVAQIFGAFPSPSTTNRQIWNSGEVVGSIRFYDEFASIHTPVKQIGKSYYHDPDFFDSMVKIANEIPRPLPPSAR